MGFSLADFLALRRPTNAAANAPASFGRAKSCIVLFCWGGISQLDTWDPKPQADAEYRGPTREIETATNGIRLGQGMPKLAQQTNRLAILRSVHHPESGHRNAAYWNLTGHEPHTPGNDNPLMPSRKDWPTLPAMVARFKHATPGFPGSVALPYALADRGLLNGYDGGFLGLHYDPLLVHPAKGKPYSGISPLGGNVDLRLPDGIDAQRMQARRELFSTVGSLADRSERTGTLDHYRQMASDLLLNPSVSAAFDLSQEPAALRTAYGDHVGGQSMLLARRLTEAGVPIVTVCCGSGDLAGGSGAMWDTHANNFQRLERDLLPPLDQGSSALLDDLAQRGRLDETLVVWLTEFGRTPRINASSGRDHFPNCYSVAMAGGGIQGGQIYGRSDKIASTPLEHACGPHDLHATIFHALGIDGESMIQDTLGRPLPLTNGRCLPLF